MPREEQEVGQLVLVTRPRLDGEFQGEGPVLLSERVGNLPGEGQRVEALLQGLLAKALFVVTRESVLHFSTRIRRRPLFRFHRFRPGKAYSVLLDGAAKLAL